MTGKFFDRAYKSFWHPFFEKLDVVIKEQSYYDGVYLGDSRVHFGINPYYVDSITNLKSYNLGMGGAPIKEILFLTKSYLQHHPSPKFAVISIAYSNLLRFNRSFQNPCYYLFYSSDSLTKVTLQNLGYHTTLYNMLPILKYTAFDDFNKRSIAENLMGHTIVKSGGVTFRGFINNTTNSFNMKEMEKTIITDTAIQTGLDLLEETIKLLTSKNTSTILVYPPAPKLIGYQKNLVEMRIDTAISKLAVKYQTPLIHFENDSSFTNSLFTDEYHLNINGTILYSSKIGEIIKTCCHSSLRIYTPNSRKKIASKA